MPPNIVMGEVYVMCNECGARLWSDYQLEKETENYRGIKCPYKTLDNQCLTPEERK